MSLTADLSFNLLATVATSQDIGTASNRVPYNKTFALTDGTGNGKAQSIWSDQRTITASSNEDLDLAGSLVDPLGNTITFTKMKTIIVFALAANTNNVEVSVPAANGFVGFLSAASDKAIVTPGGVLLWHSPDGATVTAGTGDLINFANSGAGTSVTYDVIFIGE